MLFNSIEFLLFFLTIFLFYWFVVNKNTKAQNILLLIASYVFYGWWDWRFLCLLVSLSIANYFLGIGIEKNQENSKGKILFLTGLIINLGILGIFKYYNFFIDSFIDLISLFGYDLPRSTTKIILPVGISFYTFLSLSYIIDIHKKTLSAHRNIVAVLLALSFFPIILAGPIQRPASLLPQIKKSRVFSYDQAVDGLRQILWGLFAKIVIADNLAQYVDSIFLNYYDNPGSTLFLGAVLYSIQIYADFSGYSNIAIGTANLFGFKLMRNFAYPYFSRDITEFWKRWHISLVTWFRDYVFLPLSFAVSWKIKTGKILFIKADLFIYIIASIVVWVLTGLWHGANYTFIVWGMIHGFFLIGYHVQKNSRKKLFKRIGITNKSLVIVVSETIITMCLVMIAWVFFRSENIGHAINYLSGIFSPSLFSIPRLARMTFAIKDILFIALFLLIEWQGRYQEFGIANLRFKLKRPLRYAVYYAFIIAIIYSGSQNQQFIYFQF